ncbi:MAG TPA: hypothetical protein VFZ61_14865, partial [Polyangiales bacterium]
RSLRTGSLMRRAYVALFALLAWAPACNEVRKCGRGEPGCLAGPPEDGSCQPGLVVKHGACTEPGAEPAALECGCEDGQICTLDGYTCADYCAPLDVAIGTAPPRDQYSCDPSASAAALCETRCLIRCRAWHELCRTSAGCGPESCRSDAEQAACNQACGSAPDPQRCLAQACNDQLALGCKGLSCPDGSAPQCTGVSCSNGCSGFNFDGVCDDGDLASAQSGACEYGSDCADCGPRRGAAPAPVAQGEPCAFHSNCAGASQDDLAEAQAWCIEVAPGVTRCAPDCTGADEICPRGSGCYTLQGPDQDGDGAPDPVVQGDLTASACFPSAMCQ